MLAAVSLPGLPICFSFYHLIVFRFQHTFYHSTCVIHTRFERLRKRARNSPRKSFQQSFLIKRFIAVNFLVFPFQFPINNKAQNCRDSSIKGFIFVTMSVWNLSASLVVVYKSKTIRKTFAMYQRKNSKVFAFLLLSVPLCFPFVSFEKRKGKFLHFYISTFVACHAKRAQ